MDTNGTSTDTLTLLSSVKLDDLPSTSRSFGYTRFPYIRLAVLYDLVSRGNGTYLTR